MPAMKLPSKNVRLVFGIVTISLVAGIAHVAVSAILSARSSYPQEPIMKSALLFLNRGDDPAVVLPSHAIEVESNQTWITVTDAAGSILASSATDQGKPVTLVSCRNRDVVPENCFFIPGGAVPHRLTVELPSGSRQSVVSAAWRAPDGEGYVFVGRSRDDSDMRWVFLTQLIAATWLAGLGAFWFANRVAK